MPANEDVDAFKPNYYSVYHITTNVTQLEDNAKMRSCIGYEVLEHRRIQRKSGNCKTC